MSAFGRAMIEQLERPARNVTFRMSIVGSYGINCPCRDFLEVRTEERNLIGRCLDGGTHPRVLDIGCGIGRHSSFVRALSPSASITVVESDRELRAHTVGAVPGAVGYEHFGDIPVDARFDIAFLLGNGLGVFGTEIATRDSLRQLHAMLTGRGFALIESGNFTANEFHSARHQIEYGGVIDGPFTWGYSTAGWLERQLDESGFRVLSVTPSSRGGPFFIIHATNCA